LLDIISHRSDRHFKLFLDALISDDQDDYAIALDENIAAQLIHKRNVNRGDTQGMLSVLIAFYGVLGFFVFL